MKGTMKLKIVLLALLALSASPLFAQTASNGSSIGGENSGLRANVRQFHVTANTTINVATSSVRLYGAHAAVSNAGTTWAITISAVSAGNQGAAANIVNAFTLTTNSGTPINLLGSNPPTNGYWMNGGINITFTGTAGVADIFIDYR